MPKYLSKQKKLNYLSLPSADWSNTLNQNCDQLCEPFFYTQKQQNIDCQIEQLEVKRSPQNEEQVRELNSLVKTNQHSPNIQAQRSVNQLKDADDHFNHYFNIENQIQSSKTKSYRRTKSLRKSQHLKHIAKYLILLITQNKNLSVKEISYLLYEMIGQTSLGLEIVHQRRPIISAQLKRRLAAKYYDEHSSEAHVQNLIKNVRRRLYDALNVMISSNIIQKSNKLIQISRGPKAITIKSKQPLQQTKINEEKVFLKNSKQHLFNKLKEKEAQIKKKREMLKSLQERYSLMIKLVKKNKYDEKTQSPRKIFQLPLAVIKTDLNVLVEIEKGKINVRNCRQTDLLGDMQILALALKGKSEEQGIEIESQGEVNNNF